MSIYWGCELPLGGFSQPTLAEIKKKVDFSRLKRKKIQKNGQKFDLSFKKFDLRLKSNFLKKVEFSRLKSTFVNFFEINRLNSTFSTAEPNFGTLGENVPRVLALWRSILLLPRSPLVRMRVFTPSRSRFRALSLSFSLVILCAFFDLFSRSSSLFVSLSLFLSRTLSLSVSLSPFLSISLSHPTPPH